MHPRSSPCTRAANDKLLFEYQVRWAQGIELRSCNFDAKWTFLMFFLTLVKRFVFPCLVRHLNHLWFCFTLASTVSTVVSDDSYASNWRNPVILLPRYCTTCDNLFSHSRAISPEHLQLLTRECDLNFQSKEIFQANTHIRIQTQTPTTHNNTSKNLSEICRPVNVEVGWEIILKTKVDLASTHPTYTFHVSVLDARGHEQMSEGDGTVILRYEELYTDFVKVWWRRHGSASSLDWEKAIIASRWF